MPKLRKEIIVTGWPKSGNTWITRLTAELVQCPVAGFYRSDHTEIAKEGSGRSSEFACYKAHQQLKDLPDPEKNTHLFLVYVLRDPRDIAVSGANFFKFKRLRRIEQIGPSARIVKRLTHILTESKLFQDHVYSERYRIDQMLNAILFGSRELHYWCSVPWKAHYRPFMSAKCIFIRYEDMLNDAELHCRKLLNFLGVNRSDEQIQRAIDYQSFNRAKQRFIDKGEIEKAHFLRAARPEQWRSKLSESQVGLVNSLLKEDLDCLGYS